MGDNPNPSPEDFEELSLIRALSSSTYVGAATGAGGLLVGSIVGTLRTANPILFGIGSGIQCFGLGAIYSATRQSLLYATTATTTTSTQTLPSSSSSPLPSQNFSSEPHTPKQLNIISTISGSIAGASMGALVRGRANVIPGAIFWGVAGLAGQSGWNLRERWAFEAEERRREKEFVGWRPRAAGAGAGAGAGATGASNSENQRERVSRRLDDDATVGAAVAAPEGSPDDKEPFWLHWSPMRKLSDEEYENMLKEKMLKLDVEIAIVDEDLAKLGASGQVGKTGGKAGADGRSGDGGNAGGGGGKDGRR